MVSCTVVVNGPAEVSLIHVGHVVQDGHVMLVIRSPRVYADEGHVAQVWISRREGSSEILKPEIEFYHS